MKNCFKSYLFSHHIFVSDSGADGKDAIETVVALASLFGIRITKGLEMADVKMIKLAEKELGNEVPEGFYRYYPQSVRLLTPKAALNDQVIQYLLSYGLDTLITEEHSFLEDWFARLTFREHTEIKEFEVVTEEAAGDMLEEIVSNLLKSTRPLNKDQYELVRSFIDCYGYVSNECACKDTAVQLLIDTGCIGYADYIKLPDVIRMVEEIAFYKYGLENIRKLNLKNYDRKIISQVLDYKLSCNDFDIKACYEKRALWCGILHHIHYKPKNDIARDFVKAMREGPNQSAYSVMEKAIDEGNIYLAVDTLKKEKGSGAILRNMTYLLSRCKSSDDAEYVCKNLSVRNLVILAQMLVHFDRNEKDRFENRYFRFVRNNMMKIHRETFEEKCSRKSFLPPWMIEELPFRIRHSIEEACHGRLGKVYIDPRMVHIPIPIQESTASSGYGTLPAGSRVHLDKSQIIRAFVYWEGCRDIDISGYALSDSCDRLQLYNWQTMFMRQGFDVAYSGDQTSGANGGSEYIDLDVQHFHSRFPDARYFVIMVNLYNGHWKNKDEPADYNSIICRAGYMQRDRASSGDVFEPKTVRTSYEVGGAGTMNYVMAIDLWKNDVIWLNLAINTSDRLPKHSLHFLAPYFTTQESMNLYDLFILMASEITSSPMEANVLVTDEDLEHNENAEVIRSWETEKILALINSFI